MNEASILDIISPIMVGPSSSHTAGAVRIGLLARKIYGEKIKKVIITLYNSYAQTGIGHGSDKGLLAGLLGFSVDNTIIKDIFNSIEASKIKYKFEYEENFAFHPNAVDIKFLGDIEMKISAQSVGGGEVQITKIDDFDVNINGKFNSIILVIDDTIGYISKITGIIQKYNVNIASINCERKSKGQNATCCICLDSDIDTNALKEIEKEIEPKLLRYINKL